MGDDLVSGKDRARAAYTAKSVISPLEGGEKWSAQRTESQLLGFPNDERPKWQRRAESGKAEGVPSQGVPTSYGPMRPPPVEPTPSVAFGDISPSRGEITLSTAFTNLQPSVAACRLEGHDILDPRTILMKGALLLRGSLM
jgi:hypothetical protein